jgi:hypothetical protein
MKSTAQCMHSVIFLDEVVFSTKKIKVDFLKLKRNNELTRDWGTKIFP